MIGRERSLKKMDIFHLAVFPVDIEKLLRLIITTKSHLLIANKSLYENINRTLVKKSEWKTNNWHIMERRILANTKKNKRTRDRKMGTYI